MSPRKINLESFNPVNCNKKEFVVSGYTQGQIWFLVCWKYDPVWDDGAGNIREDYVKEFATYVKIEEFDKYKEILEKRDLTEAVLNIKSENEVLKNLYTYMTCSEGDYHIEYITVAEGNIITDRKTNMSPITKDAPKQ